MNKKVFSFILSFLLVFAITTNAFAVPAKNLVPKDKGKEVKVEKVSSLERDKNAEGLKDSDKVRIIVELDKEPITKEAIKRNVDVKDLNKSVYNSLNTSLLNDQKKVKNSISSQKIVLKYHENFTNVVNGFSATSTLKEAKRIEKLKGVKRVTLANEYQRPEPLLDTSVDIMDVVPTWELDYKGEGLVVSIIDTGVDPSHQDMKLTNPEEAKLSKAEVESKGLPGKYYTDKVPYGYNYMDNNHIILDKAPEASEHGMHVAGTVGANGKVKGVAPEVQLLAMKVFGNDPGMPSTFGDVIIKAIDDSVKVGTDVINMSLGSTSAFVDEEDPEQVAVKNAVDAGVVVAVSAGNSADFGYGYGDPYADNPDYGLVGSPGLSIDTIQVASIENTNVKANALTTEDGKIIGYALAGSNDPVEVFKGKKVEFVNGGEGKMEELQDAAGKIAVIVRGGEPGPFTDKITNAAKAGAVGVIIRNHETGGNALINMQYPEGVKIPAMFIGYDDGLTLLSLLEEGKNKIEFTGELTTVANPDAGKMSDFTSWGPTPNLGFKPEITAPGGQIYSTLQNNKYGIMSGTSMAAPHVAGGSALVMERVEKDFDLEGREKAEFIKNLSMSTAKPLKERFGFTSPRREGAGVMNVLAATTTDTIVTDKTTGISKVELKEIGDKFEFTLNLKNFGDKELTYSIDTAVQSDVVQKGNNWTEPQTISNTVVSYTDMSGNSLENITVSANSSVDFKVSIDLTNAKDWPSEAPLKDIFKNGAFVDGFVMLKEVTDTAPELSIPYMGFYGEWDKAPILDDSIYEIDGNSYYGVTAMAWLDGDTYRFLGVPLGEGDPDADNIAFSPNGDGLNDEVRPILSFLRNAKELEINILDENGEVVRELTKDKDLRKNFFNNGRNPYFRSLDNWVWDGKTFGEVSEGQYTYQIKTKIDYPDAKWQTLEFPVKVDLTKPVIESLNLDKETKKLTIEATDNMTDIYKYQVIADGKVILETNKNVIDLSAIADLPDKITVKVWDYALNWTESEAMWTSEDESIPYVYITTPEAFGAVNTNEIEVKGYVESEVELAELKINDQDVEFTYDEEKERYNFETTINLEDGVHKIHVYAKNIRGSDIEFERKIFVDATDPVLEILQKPARIVGKDAKTVKAKIKVSENSGDVRVIVHGNEVFKKEVAWEYTNEFEPVEKVLELDIPVKYGNNDIKVIVEDGFGNKIEEILGKVYRKVF